MKKIIFLLLLSSVAFSCSVDSRITSSSYTTEWYYIDTLRFQVYKTKSGRKYIIMLNDSETRFIRKYIN